MHNGFVILAELVSEEAAMHFCVCDPHRSMCMVVQSSTDVNYTTRTYTCSVSPCDALQSSILKTNCALPLQFKGLSLIGCLCVLSHRYISCQQHGSLSLHAEQTRLTSVQHPQYSEVTVIAQDFGVYVGVHFVCSIRRPVCNVMSII